MPLFADIEANHKEENNPLLGTTQQINLMKSEEKPRLVVKTKEGLFLYLYKLRTGECWFEYMPPSDLYVSDGSQDEKEEQIVKIENSTDEEHFLMSHLSQIIDPEHNVKAYLHQRRLLQAFNIFNILTEVLLAIFYFSGYEDAAFNLTWESPKYFKYYEKVLKSNEFFIGITIFNLFTLIFGYFTISRHKKNLHCAFKMLLIVSITAGLTICQAHLVNLFSVIPRILLLMYTIFVGNCLLPEALTINTGDGMESGQKSSLYNKVPQLYGQDKSQNTVSTQKELSDNGNVIEAQKPKKEIFTKMI